MKIAIAQTRPITGDIPSNIEGHESLIELADSLGADCVVFPELSITGYEPALANELAIDQDDQRFDVFQNISDAKHITIAIGAPTRSGEGICISLLIFQPGKARQLYSKMHLHADEEPYFVPGPNAAGMIGNAALAICYELSIPEHAANAHQNGAEIYIASVAKSVGGVEKAMTRLGEIAREYSMAVLMSNCVGLSDGMECGGISSVWNRRGELVAQLNNADEGIMVFDTETQKVVKRKFDEGLNKGAQIEHRPFSGN